MRSIGGRSEPSCTRVGSSAGTDAGGSGRATIRRSGCFARPSSVLLSITHPVVRNFHLSTPDSSRLHRQLRLVVVHYNWRCVTPTQPHDSPKFVGEHEISQDLPSE